MAGSPADNEPSKAEQQMQAPAPVDPKTGEVGKTNWKGAAGDPNKRKSIAEDPDGKANARLVGKSKK